MISVFLGIVAFLAFISALRWRLDFYAVFAFLVAKKLPTPTEFEMQMWRQYVVKNVMNDFKKKRSM